MASTELEIKCKTRSFFVDPASDELYLSNAEGISDEEISEILRFILQQKLKVKILNLSGNYGCDILMGIFFTVNKIGDLGAASISESLKINSTLQKLYLGGNYGLIF